MTFDRKGNFYVFDGSPSQRVVRVYDSAGKFMRTIGEPGGYRVGNRNVETALRVLAARGLVPTCTVVGGRRGRKGIPASCR